MLYQYFCETGVIDGTRTYHAYLRIPQKYFDLVVPTDNYVWKPRPPRLDLFSAEHMPVLATLRIHLCVSSSPIFRFLEPNTCERVNHNQITPMLETPYFFRRSPLQVFSARTKGTALHYLSGGCRIFVFIFRCLRTVAYSPDVLIVGLWILFDDL